MSDPVLTAGLKNLQRQLDSAFPGRHRPDGWIGNRAHQTRTSGHNPDDTPGAKPAWDGDGDTVPEVRALDVSADLGPGVDSGDLVAHLIRLPGLASVVRYVIHRGRIYHARNGFAAEVHDGDPHDGHIHIEGAWSQGADAHTSFDYDLEAVPVALTDADKAWITNTIAAQTQRAIDARLPAIAKQTLMDYRIPGTATDGSPYTRNLFDLVGDQWFLTMRGTTRSGGGIPATGAFGKILDQLTALQRQVEALKPKS